MSKVLTSPCFIWYHKFYILSSERIDLNDYWTNDFNSHAHVERDTENLENVVDMGISTHTLTWSVTKTLMAIATTLKFQLTRSCGAWHDIKLIIILDKEFQLTRSCGAWLRLLRSESPISEFQLTRSCGAWHAFRFAWRLSRTFQLTRSCGAWRYIQLQALCLNHFNSHAHVERDMVWSDYILDVRISTHTLMWSVTHLIPPFCTIITISTHTLMWSVTEKTYKELQETNISTHTLMWSVTYSFQSNQHEKGHFNSHAHVERDYKADNIYYNHFGFQLTRSCGAWRRKFKRVTVKVVISTHTLMWSVTEVSIGR